MSDNPTRAGLPRLLLPSMSISPQFPFHLKIPNPRRQHSNYNTHFPFTSSTITLTPLSPQPSPKRFYLYTLPHRRYQIRLSTSDDSTPPDDNNKPFSAKGAFTKLKRYGSCGILAYGLLNTAYYITTFLVVWFYVAPPSGRFGYVAAVKRFVKVMAMVWAGSQVTKVARAAGAVGLAPFVEKGLTWCISKFKFRSQAGAYMAIVGICIGMALVLFLAVTVMSA